MLYVANVYVTLKPTVNDPQGIAIMAGLRSLGFNGIRDVRAGKFLIVQTEAPGRNAAQEQVEDMCRKLLANPVIESYRFEVTEQA
jgi:phosphoribosylformylglycinamidine synthase PurS subunit